MKDKIMKRVSVSFPSFERNCSHEKSAMYYFICLLLFDNGRMLTKGSG